MAVEKEYNEIPFLSAPEWHSQPEHLAAVASLYGFDAQDPGEARVLELCCGNGVNLISAAQLWPQSRFFGLDISSGAIAEGQEIIHGLGLTNISLNQGDVFSPFSPGESYHYIMINGAFPWFTAEQQQQLLGICADRLAANGLVYVKYLTAPGRYRGQVLRDMLAHRLKGVAEAADRIRLAREYINLIAGVVPEEGVYGQWIAELKRHVDSISDSDFFHNYMGQSANTVYFSEFMSWADSVGLKFVAESDVLADAGVPEDVKEKFRRQAADRLAYEQDIDFVCNRSGRNTLLCHAGKDIADEQDPGRIATVSVVTSARPVSPKPDIYSAAAEEFRLPNGRSVMIANTICKVAMMVLAMRWPRSIPFQELYQEVVAVLRRSGSDMAVDGLFLQQKLLLYYVNGMVDLVVGQKEMICNKLEARPRAIPLARAMVDGEFRRLRKSQQGSLVTVFNAWHRAVGLDQAHANLLAWLDGEHDIEMLKKVVEEMAARGEIDSLQENYSRFKEGGLSRQEWLFHVESFLMAALGRLLASALLVGK